MFSLAAFFWLFGEKGKSDMKNQTHFVKKVFPVFPVFSLDGCVVRGTVKVPDGRVT